METNNTMVTGSRLHWEDKQRFMTAGNDAALLRRDCTNPRPNLPKITVAIWNVHKTRGFWTPLGGLSERSGTLRYTLEMESQGGFGSRHMEEVTVDQRLPTPSLRRNISWKQITPVQFITEGVNEYATELNYSPSIALKQWEETARSAKGQRKVVWHLVNSSGFISFFWSINTTYLDIKTKGCSLRHSPYCGT